LKKKFLLLSVLIISTLSSSFILLLTTANQTYVFAQIGGSCDPSYPDICIASPPPTLNCADIQDKKFTVLQPDPHGFDRDGNGIGCETQIGGSCDPSYPDICIASPPPTLNCADIQDKKFTVLQPDPHGFDLDGNGIGCES
jgi:hypothetical protein